MNGFWLPTATLWRREIVRFYRDPSRILGALAPPIVFWFLLGTGLGTPVRQYLFSGTLVLIVLFTSVFATISIIEDRREGFLQSVLVAPINPLALVLGKILGSASVGGLQGMAFLAMAPAAGLNAGAGAYLWALTALLLCSLSLTAIGFCIAWVMESTQGFHAVMNLFLIPLWMLSGATFPLSSAPAWLQWVMRANPVSYAVSALQQAFPAGPLASPVASLRVCLAVLSLFSTVMLVLSAWIARRRDWR